MLMPEREGFWWGRWMRPAPGTADIDADTWPQGEWEVMHVVVNCVDPKSDEHLMVMVPGVQKWQALDAFNWGPKVYQPGGLPLD